MVYKVKLKNADASVVVDASVYEWLTTDPYLVQIDFINNLRRHSSGCAVFQKTWRKAVIGAFKTETIYLHKIIAERFLADQKEDKRLFVGAKNGDKLDCRLENLVYRTRAVASRQRRTTSKTGFTGVYREHGRYRSVISVKGKPIHIGMFDTAEEAAMAYNKLSKELFGEDGKVNRVGGR
jgi:HNH endonuclease